MRNYSVLAFILSISIHTTIIYFLFSNKVSNNQEPIKLIKPVSLTFKNISSSNANNSNDIINRKNITKKIIKPPLKPHIKKIKIKKSKHTYKKDNHKPNKNTKKEVRKVPVKTIEKTSSNKSYSTNNITNAKVLSKGNKNKYFGKIIRQGLIGKVKLKILVGINGKPKDIVFLEKSNSSKINRAAKKFAHSYRFLPAKINKIAFEKWEAIIIDVK